MCPFWSNDASKRKKEGEGRQGDMKLALDGGDYVAHKPSRSDSLSTISLKVGAPAYHSASSPHRVRSIQLLDLRRLKYHSWCKSPAVSSTVTLQFSVHYTELDRL